MQTLYRAATTILIFLSVAVPWTNAQTPPKPTSEADDSQEASVIERSFTRWSFNADGTGAKETAVAIHVQAESAVQQLAVLTFAYASENETIEIDYVRVRKPDGTVVVTPAYNIQDFPSAVARIAPMYSDSHEKHITVKGLAVGDRLEYAVRQHIVKPYIAGHFWMEYWFQTNSVVKQEQLELSAPADKYVKVLSSELQPEIREEGGRRIYTWLTANVYRKNPAAALGPSRHAPVPSVQVTTFRTWEEVGSWYRELQTPQARVTPAIQAKASELTKGLTSDDDKIHALYNYVSTKFHYISLSFGIGRFEPHPAEDVLENGYGDCKDKHTLLAALLKAAGIEAWPALINASWPINADAPSPGQFNHLITVLLRGDKLLWLDTTPEVGPFAYLIRNIRDKQALVMPSGKTPSLIKTPADPPFPERYTFTADSKLSADGTLKGHMQRAYRGDAEVLLRAMFRAAPPADWKELVQRVSAGTGFGGQVDAVNASKPDDTDKPFEFEYDYTRKDYADWEHQRITPPLPWLGVEGSSANEEKPTEPFFLGTPGDVIYRAKLELPQGYSLTPPPKVDLVSDYAEFHAEYAFEKGVLTATRRLAIKKSEIPPEKWDEFSKFRKGVGEDYGFLIALSSGAGDKSAKPTAASTSPQGPDELSVSVNAALTAQNYTLAVELLKQMTAASPQNVWAWANLGTANWNLKRYDDAAAAYRKQMELDPGTSSGYTNLARMLVAQQKMDEARQVFEKLIAAMPRDPQPHMNLASLLSGLKQFEGAAREYAAAAEIKPDDAAIQLSLGKAYLESGQTDKAVDALDRALARDGAALMRNNVAWALAEKNVRIDKAQPLAESAVASLEGQLRDIQVTDLDVKDLRAVSLLGSAWDTLGWVYFEQGDPEKAEKFLLAAWNLDQHNLMADHLGQLYEKQGRTRLATQYYALAEAVAPFAHARERLLALLGSQADANVQLAKARNGLASSRTLSVSTGKPRVKRESAEFFVGVSADGKASWTRFISGDASLKLGAGGLLRSKVGEAVPDGAPITLVRRGILSCSAGTAPCQFVLLLPSDVKTLD